MYFTYPLCVCVCVDRQAVTYKRCSHVIHKVSWRPGCFGWIACSSCVRVDLDVDPLNLSMYVKQLDVSLGWRGCCLLLERERGFQTMCIVYVMYNMCITYVYVVMKICSCYAVKVQSEGHLKCTPSSPSTLLRPYHECKFRITLLSEINPKPLIIKGAYNWRYAS